MRFERTSDMSLVSKMLSPDPIRRRCTHDGSPPTDEYLDIIESANKAANFEFVIARTNAGVPAGLFILRRLENSPGSAEGYTAFLPHAWGCAVTTARLFLAWVSRETSLRHLVVQVPSYNRLSLSMAKNLGFEETARYVDFGTKQCRPFDLIRLELCYERKAGGVV